MKRKTTDIWLYLLLIAALWLFCLVSLNIWLKPYSISYMNTGKMTPGYFVYALIGLLFSTPAPFLSVLIIALCREKISIKAFFKRLLHTPKPLNAIVLTSGFCGFALVFALIKGIPNGTPWYMLPLGLLAMIPFVGIAEESGWRGFLQPELEKRIKFPFSVLIVAAIWFIWHIDLWFDPTSNHYNDSLTGFGLNIFIWSFALAALYKATGSVLACAVYHAFIDAIGAVYDWNALFDTFPGDLYTNAYRIILLTGSIALWVYTDKSCRAGKSLQLTPSLGMPLGIRCPAFGKNGEIPIKHTGFGEDISPEIYIDNLSAKAKTLAVIMDDLDVPFRRELNHWLIWNLPPENVIPEHVPAGSKLPGGAMQGIAYGKNCYRGPKQPPFIKKAHRYRFSVFALDCALKLPVSSQKKALLQAMSGHILQTGELTGWYRP